MRERGFSWAEIAVELGLSGGGAARNVAYPPWDRYKEGDVMIPVELTELDLTTRARNSLDRAGVETVAELCRCRAAGLMRVPYLGAGQVAQIRAALARHGLDLAPPVTPAVSARQEAQRARRQRERAMRTPARARDAELARWHGLRWRHGA